MIWSLRDRLALTVEFWRETLELPGMEPLRGQLLVKDTSASYLSLVDLWKEREVELEEGTLTIKSKMTGRIKSEIVLKGSRYRSHDSREFAEKSVWQDLSFSARPKRLKEPLPNPANLKRCLPFIRLCVL